MRKITLEIPSGIPPALKSNRSRYQHFRKTTAAKNEFQRLIYLIGYDARQKYEDQTGENWEPIKAGIIHLKLVIKNRRYIQDSTNVIWAMKPLYDELQTEKKGKIAGCGIIVNDKNFKVGKVEWEVDAERAPLIIVTVEEKRTRK